jgi:hypothetical protein
MIPDPPSIWPGGDRNQPSCSDKVKVLAENHAELPQMQDTFKGAVLMGVDEIAMRGILAGMIQGLQAPKRAAR